jgi:hypothetical protein
MWPSLAISSYNDWTTEWDALSPNFMRNLPFYPAQEVQQLLSPPLSFTSAPILTSSVSVNSFSAKATGHAVPSSRLALSLKLDLAYRHYELGQETERLVS